MPVYVSNETDQFSWFRLHIITDMFLALANIPSLCLILAGHTTHISKPIYDKMLRMPSESQC